MGEPKEVERVRTAILPVGVIVCHPGLTQAVIDLWITQAQKRVAFDMRLFNTLEEAEAWLGVGEAMLA
ncbi:hypothetical protein [Pontiella sulfatireligans]|uniref:STAS/SEC14 domain-containing protein n=1 Tax=Pontiella sulfatireligans TaxID=2750658 RepID=A0A6C2UDC9_9BACT|nr:hypothetical protein [Pontiella sulfatireligans]VGO18212.1 hypothetical protein SCARR_00263 [Pontiella sulfatireligans]